MTASCASCSSFCSTYWAKLPGYEQQLAAVELDDARRHPVQERAVVGDGDNAAAEVDQQVFEPFDRVEVQVVGRLVEQKHVGRGHQRLRQGDALLGAAREGADAGLWVQVQALQRLFHALLPVPGVVGLDLRLQSVEVQVFSAAQVLVADGNHMRQAVRGRVKDRGLGVQIGFLRHIGNAHALLQVQRAVVRHVRGPPES